MNNLNMSKNLFAVLLTAAATIGSVTDVSARPQYVIPTGAAGCASCHLDSLGGRGWKPGVLAAFDQGGIAGLKAFLNPVANNNTAPVLHPINNQWDVTVGEAALVIPLQVTDKENDTFSLHGSAPTGYKVSPVTSTAPSNIPTINLSWTPTAAQANKNYTLSLYVQETGVGRTLKSNTVTANIHVWSARVSATKNISQFIVQSAQWKANQLAIAGQVIFKPKLTAAKRSAALKALTLEVKSNSGLVIGQPLKLTVDANGNWQKNLALTASEVPCLVKLNYEGLNAARTVQLAPSTCVK